MEYFLARGYRLVQFPLFRARFHAADGGMLIASGGAVTLTISGSSDTSSDTKGEFNVPITLKNGADLILTNVKAGGTITIEDSENRSQLWLTKSELTQKLSFPSNSCVLIRQ